MTADKAVTIFSADTLDKAATGAVERMAAFLTDPRASLCPTPPCSSASPATFASARS